MMSDQDRLAVERLIQLAEFYTEELPWKDSHAAIADWEAGVAAWKRIQLAAGNMACTNTLIWGKDAK